MCQQQRSSGSTTPVTASAGQRTALTEEQVVKIAVIIRRVVKQKCRRWQWDRQDDAIQDTWECLIRRLVKHNPARGSVEAFAEKVIPGIVIDLKRRSKAKKRQPLESLEYAQGPLGSARDTVTVLHQLHPPQGASLNGHLIPLRMDVEQLVTRLNGRDREMAEAVMGQSVTDYSRSSGIPRSTVRYRLKAQKSKAQQGCLHEYLHRLVKR